MESICTSVGRGRSAQEARGFTIVEMMVVLAIIAVVTTIALVGQSTFDKSLLITDTAYRVALSLRQMQTYGLSSRITTTSVHDAGYGAHFANTGQTMSSYILFADTDNSSSVTNSYCVVGTDQDLPDYKPGECVYTSIDQTVENYTFSRGFKILRFCGKTGTGTKYCSDSSANLQKLSALDIVFLRPNPDSIITGTPTGPVQPPAFASAEIILTTATGAATRAICISRVGQISVSLTTCP